MVKKALLTFLFNSFQPARCRFRSALAILQLPITVSLPAPSHSMLSRSCGIMKRSRRYDIQWWYLGWCHPRLRCFERLGQLYGVDLFIRKPIQTLQENLRTEVFELSDYVRINEAVQCALSRPRHTVYDPVIIISEDGKKRLLDMHMLLSVQSQVVMNSLNVMSNLDRVTRALSKPINCSKVYPMPSILFG